MFGRVAGAGWTAALALSVGIGGYGRYAIAYSLSSLVAGVLDGPPTLRAARLTDSEFDGDQRRRGLLGPPIMAGGLFIAITFDYVIGYAIVFAAGEFIFGIAKTEARRNGNPKREQILDVSRQLASIGLALLDIWLKVGGLTGITFAYSIPYLILAATLPLRAIRLAPSAVHAREWALLAVSGMVSAGYMQLDVVILGAILNSTAAGIYGIASLVGWAATAPAQQLTTRKIPDVRKGTLEPAELVGGVLLPALSSVALISAGVAGHVLHIGPRALGTSLLLMAPFAWTRCSNWALTIAAVFVRADRMRLLVAGVALLVDILAIVLLASPLGAPCASVASGVSDLVLAVGYALIVTYEPSFEMVVGYGLSIAASTAAAVLLASSQGEHRTAAQPNQTTHHGATRQEPPTSDSQYLQNRARDASLDIRRGSHLPSAPTPTGVPISHDGERRA